MYNAEDQKERAAKALKLNGFDYYDYDNSSLYPVSNTPGSIAKPTIMIKRLPLQVRRKSRPDCPVMRLKGASTIQDKVKLEREKAEKALKLNSGF